MYTQCPDCQIAFRVTATVLQQAKGRVRCGGCGHAFSALDYLTEEMPGNLNTGPELAADTPAETSDEDFAAQSQRLLQTLEELAAPSDEHGDAGGDEWQVETDGSIDAEKVPRVTEQVNVVDPEDTQHNLSLVGAAGAAAELRYDDNTPLPDDFDDAEHTPYTPPVDKPRRREGDRVDPVSPEFLDKQGDFSLIEPDEWTDILDEVGAAALEVRPDDAESLPEVITASHETDDAPADDGVAGDESVAAAAARAADDKEPATDAEAPEPVAHFDSTAVFEEQIAAARDALARGEFEANGDDAGEEPADEDGDEKHQPAAAELAIAKIVEDTPRPEVIDAHAQEDVPTTDDDYLIQPQSESEQSINKEIDQQLLLASTHDRLLVKTIAGDKFDVDEKDLNVETIVMQGDIVGDALDAGEVEGRDHAAGDDQAEESLIDTYVFNRSKGAGGRRRTDRPGARIYLAVGFLGLALLAQFMHTSRESLATFGMFNQTIGPVYRAFGRPISPDWDIKGWQFEATNGSTDENGQRLTILSRIVNQSEQSLPYPLIHVSLTDRWEEIIGSRVLEPAEYLAGEIDPSRPLETGERFTAAITIDNPSDAATGFKLNVCYRVVPGEVRCAIEDFKN
ncbi:MAG: zinc-ribbon and DUF3426 domain-containing protein [Gammaproteobacteria bacterium]|nr:zinc-ribbon and DUF3426 domain-containing protein [Gammaproteobacteria bacterium]